MNLIQNGLVTLEDLDAKQLQQYLAYVEALQCEAALNKS